MEKKNDLEKITNYSEKQMWKDDLDVFLKYLDKIENSEQVKKDKADQKIAKKFANHQEK